LINPRELFSDVGIIGAVGINFALFFLALDKPKISQIIGEYDNN
jgi:hypothetical protein